MKTKSSKLEKLNVLKKSKPLEISTDQIQYIFKMLILCPKLKG